MALTDGYLKVIPISSVNLISPSDLENMVPWEREIYVDMLTRYIQEENERIRRENSKHYFLYQLIYL